jgi:hypothetical protein
MENKDLVTQDISIADDFLIQVAEHAERRIDAVMKIKKVALKVTNPRDWTDQQGNPYLMASGSEKIANLFNISWRIDEPIYEEDPDGHYTYSYKGFFSLGSRTTEAEGSRSSRDGFFKQYLYEEKERKEISILERTNKRDVKMAALTNLLGNGITRILGIRNLTWEDLKEFANITKDQVTAIQYRKGGEKSPISQPQELKKNGDQKPKDTETLITLVDNVTMKDGKNEKTGKSWTKYTIHVGDKDYSTFDKNIAKDADQAKKSAVNVNLEFKNTTYGPEIVSLTIQGPPEDGENAQ